MGTGEERWLNECDTRRQVITLAWSHWLDGSGSGSASSQSTLEVSPLDTKTIGRLSLFPSFSIWPVLQCVLSLSHQVQSGHQRHPRLKQAYKLLHYSINVANGHLYSGQWKASRVPLAKQSISAFEWHTLQLTAQQTYTKYQKRERKRNGEGQLSFVCVYHSLGTLLPPRTKAQSARKRHFLALSKSRKN